MTASAFSAAWQSARENNRLSVPRLRQDVPPSVPAVLLGHTGMGYPGLLLFWSNRPARAP